MPKFFTMPSCPAFQSAESMAPGLLWLCLFIDPIFFCSELLDFFLILEECHTQAFRQLFDFFDFAAFDSS
jgi:hypothetical protein